MTDLIVVGAGPAGRALTHRAVAAGLRVMLVDPAPEAPWTATIGMFTDDLPAWIDAGVIATLAPEPVVYTPERRRLPRPYAVLDSAKLQTALSVSGAHLVTARAADLTDTTVRTEFGTVYQAKHVIDARGADPHAPNRAPRQRAAGTFHLATVADRRDAVVMDWRGTGDAQPTFRYRVPVDARTVLIEETSLAAHPPIDRADLESLHARSVATRAQTRPPEWVDFPLWSRRRPWHRARGTALNFGAAGGMMNPASGYSIAESLGAVDAIVGAIVAGRSPRKALWPWQAKAVYLLRLIGLGVLLTMDGPQLTTFFDRFFRLRARSQRAYLSGRTDLRGVLWAMLGVFLRVPWKLKVQVAKGSFRIP